jgi:hypothetical protein
MLAFQRKLVVTKTPCGERHQILRAKRRELREQLAQRRAPALLQPRQPVERWKGPITALLENAPRTRYPVRALRVHQMSDDEERAPGVRAFGRVDPVG